MPYGNTGINGVSVMANGVLAPDPIPLNTPFSLRVWVSVRMDAPATDTLTLHVEVKRPDGTVPYQGDHEIALAPGDGYEFHEIGPFTADSSGYWLINLILDSALDGAELMVFAIGRHVSGDGNGNGVKVAYQQCVHCGKQLKITYTEKTGYFPIWQTCVCPACGGDNQCPGAWQISNIEVVGIAGMSMLVPILVIGGIAAIAVLAKRRKL
jgi:hypothetical protein